MQLTGKLLEALAFAVDRHRFHRRKDRRLSPYVHHLIDVLNLLWQIGGIREENLLIAGILHDVIEDTNTTPEEIKEKFGAQVLAYVLEVSDDKAQPQATRKRMQVLKAGSKSVGAKHLQLADKIANLQDLQLRPPVGWTVERRHDYANWAKEVIAPIRGTNESLENLFDEVVQAVLAKTNDEQTRFVSHPSH
jgi:guanosine-3',5'-bis(diphosphate) 3'-pyrophosphohydrolase